MRTDPHNPIPGLLYLLLLPLVLLLSNGCGDDSGTNVPTVDNHRYLVKVSAVEDEQGTRTTTLTFPRRDGDGSLMLYDLYYDGELVPEAYDSLWYCDISVLTPDWWPFGDDPLELTFDFHDGIPWDTQTPVFEPIRTDLAVMPGDTLAVGDSLTVRLVDQWLNNAWLEVDTGDRSTNKDDFYPDSTATLDLRNKTGVFRVTLHRDEAVWGSVPDQENQRTLYESWWIEYDRHFWVRR